MPTPSRKLMEALAVTAELCGGEISEAAARIMLADLSEFPEAAVMAALKRVRNEHKGRLVLPAIIERIDDGRPGVETAWSMVPRSERQTAVLTVEMLAALAIAQPLLDSGDEVAARMAFKEAYIAAVQKARADRVPAVWQPSIGWDMGGRPLPLAEAVTLERITLQSAEQHLHGDSLRDLLELVGALNHPALAPPKKGAARVLEFARRKPIEQTPTAATTAPARKKWGKLYTNDSDTPGAA